MDQFLFVVYFVTIVFFSFFIIKYSLSSLKKSKYRTLVLVLVILSQVLFLPLLISTRFMPGTVKRYMALGVEQIEQRINEVEPDYTNKVLEKDKIIDFLQSSKEIQQYFNTYTEDFPFIVYLFGANTYLYFLEKFTDNIEENMLHFEKKNIPFTLHNILSFLNEETIVKIDRMMNSIALVLFILSVLTNALILLLAVAVKKQWIKTENYIVYGEGIH